MRQQFLATQFPSATVMMQLWQRQSDNDDMRAMAWQRWHGSNGTVTMAR